MNSQANHNHLPFEKSFSGHETFAFRFAWLKKGVDSLSQDPHVFQREDAIMKLGVGKNMVRSIKYWCLATRVADSATGNHHGMAPTILGAKLLCDDGWDPYLEDDGTLWLLHWNLASYRTRAATWYWAFNMYHEYAFTKQTLFEALNKDLQKIGWQGISNATLSRDIECFIHTYTSPRLLKSIDYNSLECPLTQLSLVIEEPDGQRYRFKVGPKASLPKEIFAYALTQYWNNKNHQARSMELREILRAEGSPTQVFKLNEESVLDYLDQLKAISNDQIIFQDTPLVRRIVKRNSDPIDSISILEDYYRGR